MKRAIKMSLIGLLAMGLFVSCDKDEKKNDEGLVTETSIQGKVTDKETGEPLSDVTVELQPADVQVQTAEDGLYTFEELKAGTYTLKAQKEGYVDYTKDDIQLIAGQSLTLNIEMEKSDNEETSIQGKVTDKETGKPLSGVTIELQPVDVQVQTAEDGLYIFEDLEAGTYTLKAQKEGYVDYTKDDIQLIPNQPLSLDIEMEVPVELPDYTETAFGMNLEMVYVAGGTFEMGATAEQGNDAWGDETPVRTIKLDGYYIGKYEVTQAQWEKVMGTTLQEKMALSDYNMMGTVGEGADYPMYYISWDDAQEFCKKLSEQTGKQYVLPTEAQWEYAARGGNKSQHYKFAGSNDIEEVAWYSENSEDVGKTDPNYGTHQVGQKKPNELGLYDMSGNVNEWCLDGYDEHYKVNDTDNPQVPATKWGYVHRGGNWDRIDWSCRVSSRGYDDHNHNYYDLGFRVAVRL